MKRMIQFYFVFGFLIIAHATDKSVKGIDFTPQCTSLISPQDGSFSVPLSADLVWNEVLDATGYILTVGTSPGGSDIIDAMDVGNALSFNPTSNFPGSASFTNPTFIYVTITPYNETGNAENCIEESFTTFLEECPSIPPIPGLSLGRFMCSGDMTMTEPLFVGLQDEEWEIIEPNPNISGQTQPAVDDLFIDDILVNNTNIIQSVSYRRTYTSSCPLISGDQTFVFFVRPDNEANQFQQFEIEDDTESGSNTDGISLFDLQSFNSNLENIIHTPVSSPSVSYYETEEDAINDISPLSDFYQNNIPFAQTIYAIVTNENPTNNDENCIVPIPIALIVTNTTTIENPPIDLEVCEESGSGGFGIFDLTVNTPIVIGGQDPMSLTIAYYETQVEADTESNPIANTTSYINTVNPQSIFVRVDDLSNGTFEIGVFTLIVHPLPTAVQPAIFELCDDIESGSDTDGLAIFDLQSTSGEIAGGDPTLTVTFHLTQNDADIGTPELPDIYQNITPAFQTIWVRVESAVTGCYELITLTIAVIPLPTPITPADYEVCDTDNDGIFDAFELSTRDDEIIGGEIGLTVSYHITETDAINGVLALDANMFINNEPNFQTVYARVSNMQGCFSIVPVNLVVLNSPIINSPTPLIACDEEMDGIEVFDLGSKETEILNGIDPGTVTINWFVSLSDAEAGFPIIEAPFNYVSSTATVFASVTDILQSTTTFCQTITSLDLIVEENCIDSDDDGVTDMDEDLNGNGNLDDDDTDGDGTPNYLDDDDDGDTVMTIDEITGIGAGLTTFEFIDTDDDTIENYLDDDDDGDSILTIDEDYNDSGSPLDDDTNDNGIPDFLDADVALSVSNFEIERVTIYPNPVVDIMTIQSTIPVSTIEIYDLHGKRILTFDLAQNNSHDLHIEQLKAGVYFMKINQENSIYKLIKK